MHRHVMWALCDVSVVQPNLYFGLSGWGHATLKIVPMYAHLNLSCSKRGGAKGLPYAQACHVDCVMSQQCSLTCILVCLVGGIDS